MSGVPRPGLSLLLLLLPAFAAHANGAGVAGASGAPGTTTCSSCHSGGAFAANLSLSSGPTTVAPGSANDYELLLSGASVPAGGFDLSASDGTLGVSSAANGDGVQADGNDLTHTAAKAASGGEVRWAFQWTAPATPGTYTLYACGEPVDGDATEAGDGPEACMTQAITVVGDSAPVAVADNYSTPFGTTLNVAAPGVLDNDSDADGDPITAQLVTTVAHGTLTLNANGSFRYVPASGYNGHDSFTYKASDGTKASSVVSVQITIASNTAPLAAPDSYRTPQDTQLDVPAPGLLRNDSDANGDALHAVKVTDPAHGTLTLRADGSFTYLPEAGYHGFDSFTYQASDGFDNSSVATVNLTVDPPSGSERVGTSGGGAPGGGLLLVLALAAALRRAHAGRPA